MAEMDVSTSTSSALPAESLPLVAAVNTLPVELLTHVFSFVDSISQKRSQTVCTLWNEVLRSPSVLSLVKLSIGHDLSKLVKRTNERRKKQNSHAFLKKLVTRYTQKIIFINEETGEKRVREAEMDDENDEWEEDNECVQGLFCECGRDKVVSKFLWEMACKKKSGERQVWKVALDNVNVCFPYLLDSPVWKDRNSLVIYMKNVHLSEVCSAVKLGGDGTGLRYPGFSVMVDEERLEFPVDESLEESERKIWKVVEDNVEQLDSKERKSMRRLWVKEVERSKFTPTAVCRLIQLREPEFKDGFTSLGTIDWKMLKVSTIREALLCMQHLERRRTENGMGVFRVIGMMLGAQFGEVSDDEESEEEDADEEMPHLEPNHDVHNMFYGMLQHFVGHLNGN